MIENKSESKQTVFWYLLKHESATKQDLFTNLGLSLPTIKSVLENLASEQLIEVSGKVKNTGGRNAVTYSVTDNSRYSVGIYLSANHLTAVAVNLKGNIICSRRIRIAMSLHDESYLKAIGSLVQEICELTGLPESALLGVGIAIPSMVAEDGEHILFGMTHDYSGINKQVLSRYIPYSTFLYHDSYAAGLAEVWLNPQLQNTVYLNLNNTVGGCIIIDGKIFSGSNCRAGEFGHILVEPKRGRKCYCGKTGCLDTVCNTGILENYLDKSLDDFFAKLREKDPGVRELWDTYVEYLAIAIHNCRMVFDCSVIIGGYLGAYMGENIEDLYRKVDEYSIFASSARDYIHPCSYKIDATAAGAAIGVVERFIQTL